MDKKSYKQGQQDAWAATLRQIIRNLGSNGSDVGSHVKWIVERAEAFAVLRSACDDLGHEEWPEEFSLAEAIEEYSNHVKMFLKFSKGEIVCKGDLFLGTGCKACSKCFQQAEKNWLKATGEYGSE